MRDIRSRRLAAGDVSGMRRQDGRVGAGRRGQWRSRRRCPYRSMPESLRLRNSVRQSFYEVRGSV